MIAALAHDATALAWFIVAAYFVGAAAAFQAARSAGIGRDRLFWAGCVLVLVLLGLNKQLDLQGAITSFGRELAREGGWYGDRRLVQAAFVLALGAAAGAAMVGLLIWLRRSAAAVRLAAAGIVLLLAFILLRAASFHHMDGWVTRNVGGLRSGWWLELAGIAVVTAAAVLYGRRRHGRGHQQ